MQVALWAPSMAERDNPRGSSQAPMTAVQSVHGAPWCSKAEPNWQSWQPVPWQCKLKTPSAVALPVGLAHSPDCHFHSHPNAG